MTEPARALHRHFLAMACNNAWANHRLLGACAALTNAEFTAPRTSFFPSLAATLNHQVTVDWFYVDALERALAGRPPNERPGAFFEPEAPFDACAPLREAQRDVDARLIALCREACARGFDLETPVCILRRAGPQSDAFHRLLAHLFQHQIHHRGQAHAMLAGTRVAPPQLDEFFCAGDAQHRAGDLAELGFSEAELWGAGVATLPE